MTSKRVEYCVTERMLEHMQGTSMATKDADLGAHVCQEIHLVTSVCESTGYERITRFMLVSHRC